MEMQWNDLHNAEQDIRDTVRVFEVVYLCKLFHDSGRLSTLLSNIPEHLDGDMNFEVYQIAVDFLSEALWQHYTEYTQVETLYISHPDMMEYYRLCRVYSKRYCVELGGNPYMIKAARYVQSRLYQPGCYTCNYHLQTKVNHQWASGIVFRMSPEFYGHFALIVVLHDILHFYGEQLQLLRNELNVGIDTYTEMEAA